MKKFLLTSVLFLFFYSAKCQFTLEHTYPYGSTLTSFCQLFIVDFEVEGQLYVRIDRSAHTMFIYDLNHSLVKSIIVPDSLMNLNNAFNRGEVIYLSEHLFNSDDSIEYMIVTHNGSTTAILNEEGDLLFYKYNQSPMVNANYPQQQYPIYSTPSGTKMILSASYFPNDSAYVYGLTGTWSGQQSQLLNSNETTTKIYPNPSSDFVTIEYSLPLGINSGMIIFYSLDGKKMKSFKVDNTFDELNLSNEDLPSGTYLYALKINDAVIQTKKMIVIK